MTKAKLQQHNSKLDQQIEDCHEEINCLTDGFISCKIPLFESEFDTYKLLTVKLYRLELKKELENSSAYIADYCDNYTVVTGYKI